SQPLRQRIAVSLPEIDAKQQCTHQYDLLMVALVQAARPGYREYVSRVVGAMHEYRHAELWLNDEKLLDWRLRGTAIHSNDQFDRSEEHTSELQSRENLVCRPLLEKKNTK